MQLVSLLIIIFALYFSLIYLIIIILRMKKILLTTIMLMTILCSHANNYVPEVWGNIIEMTSWDAMSEYSKPYGVYSFPAKADGFKFNWLSKSKKSLNFYPTGNGIITSDGLYHFVVYDFDDYSYSYYTQLYTYNTKTWELQGSPKDVSSSFRAFDLAQDPTDGVVYGFFMTDKGYQFGTIDYNTNKQTFISKPDTAFYGLACSNEGQLYAISEGGSLFKITKNGEQTLVGSLGLREQGLTVQDRVQSATIDTRTNKMYWSAYLWDNKAKEYRTGLYEINTSTGKATLIVTFPELAQVVALYIPKPEAEDNAPAAATNVKALFNGPSSHGYITFTAPSQTYTGQPLTGTLAYNVTIGKDTLSKGTCNAGEQVSVPVAVNIEKGCEKEFTVRTTNVAGISPKADVKKWIGYDKTSIPTHVSFNYTDGQATITWNEPDSTIHKGYMDATNIKYNIVRYPDSVIVGNVTNTNFFKETLNSSSYKKFSYGIVAVNGGISSDTAYSNKIAVGPAYDIPYKEDFVRTGAFDEYTSIDVNGDKTDKALWGYLVEKSGYWGENSKGSPVYRSSNNDANDWIITPGLNLQKNKTYKLIFDTYRDVKRYEEVMSVGLGASMNVDDYKIIADSIHPEYNIPTPHSVTFTIKQDGVYHVGFHAISPKKQSAIFLNNIEIIETIPNAIETISLKAKEEIDIFSLTGEKVYMGTKIPTKLKKGVYIINGKKTVIK